MSKVAVHINPESKKIVGVWLDIKGTPTSFYQHDSGYQRQLGQSYIASRIRGSWDDFIDRLATRTPTDIWWESIDALDQETPKQAFDRVSKKK